MTDVITGRTSVAGTAPVSDLFAQALATSLPRLDPSQRRVLAAAVRRAADLEAKEGEDAACALIDQVIAILKRR